MKRQIRYLTTLYNIKKEDCLREIESNYMCSGYLVEFLKNKTDDLYKIVIYKISGE